MELRAGQRLNLKYKGRALEAIIINPHAFGHNKPSIGLNFSMGERCAGITHNKFVQWTRKTRSKNPEDFADTDTVQYFELPQSKKQFAIHHLPFDESDYKLGYGNLTINYHKVIEASEFIDLCFEVLTHIKLPYQSKEKLKDFLKWFAIEGFYAQAYTIIRGAYTKADSEQLHQWLEARLRNKAERLPYARCVVELHENPAYWTNYTYLNLFGKIASEMRDEWQTIDGSPQIARNHIAESLGLEAVGFVERMTTDLYAGDLQEAHDIAIKTAKRKFKLPEPEDVNIEKLFSAKTLKLNPDQVKEIRKLFKNGMPIKDIAERYNVTPGAIAYRCADREKSN
jgi:Helix-turn-helix domain of resolvase